MGSLSRNANKETDKRRKFHSNARKEIRKLEKAGEFHRANQMAAFYESNGIQASGNIASYDQNKKRIGQEKSFIAQEARKNKAHQANQQAGLASDGSDAGVITGNSSTGKTRRVANGKGGIMTVDSNGNKVNTNYSNVNTNYKPRKEISTGTTGAKGKPNKVTGFDGKAVADPFATEGRPDEGGFGISRPMQKESQALRDYKIEKKYKEKMAGMEDSPFSDNDPFSFIKNKEKREEARSKWDNSPEKAAKGKSEADSAMKQFNHDNSVIDAEKKKRRDNILAGKNADGGEATDYGKVVADARKILKDTDWADSPTMTDTLNKVDKIIKSQKDGTYGDDKEVSVDPFTKPNPYDQAIGQLEQRKESRIDFLKAESDYNDKALSTPFSRATDTDFNERVGSLREHVKTINPPRITNQSMYGTDDPNKAVPAPYDMGANAAPIIWGAPKRGSDNPFPDDKGTFSPSNPFEDFAKPSNGLFPEMPQPIDKWTNFRPLVPPLRSNKLTFPR